jgi:hypothetical protein
LNRPGGGHSVKTRMSGAPSTRGRAERHGHTLRATLLDRGIGIVFSTLCLPFLGRRGFEGRLGSARFGQTEVRVVDLIRVVFRSRIRVHGHQEQQGVLVRWRGGLNSQSICNQFCLQVLLLSGSVLRLVLLSSFALPCILSGMDDERKGHCVFYVVELICPVGVGDICSGCVVWYGLLG